MGRFFEWDVKWTRLSKKSRKPNHFANQDFLHIFCWPTFYFYSFSPGLFLLTKHCLLRSHKLKSLVCNLLACKHFFPTLQKEFISQTKPSYCNERNEKKLVFRKGTKLLFSVGFFSVRELWVNTACFFKRWLILVTYKNIVISRLRDFKNGLLQMIEHLSYSFQKMLKT